MTRTVIGQEGAGSSEQVEQEVQGRAQQVAGRTKGTLRDQLDRRSTQAGEQLHGQATDVRAIARELREQGKERPARLAEQGAQYVERLGGYLRDADADRLLADVEGFARSKAWAVVAGAGALGFAASRLGLAVGAAAAGFLAGLLLLPKTRVEDERLGPLADQVKDTVQQTGQEAVERGEHVAQAAAQTAAQQARDQGRDLAGSARSRAQDLTRQDPPRSS